MALSPERLALAAIIASASIGFAGSFAATYLWWRLTAKNTKHLVINLAGITSLVVFLFLFLYAFSLFRT